MPGINWGMAAGGAEQAMQSLLEERILKEKMALAQRQQQAEEQYRAAQLAEQAAGRGDTNTRFNAELGWNKEKFGAEAPGREADVSHTKALTGGQIIKNVSEGMQAGETARVLGLRKGAEDRIAARPGGQAVLDAGHAGVTSKGVDPTDMDSAGDRAFTAGENDKNRRATVAAAGARAKGDAWVRVPFFNPATQQNEIYYGPQSGAPTGTFAASKPAALATTIAGGKATIEQLHEMRAMYKPEFVGPATGRALDLAAQTPGVSLPEGYPEFRASVTAFNNDMIKLITGAQMSEPEAQRIMRQLPNLENKPEIWIANFDQSLKTRERLLRMQTGGAAAAPADTGGETQTRTLRNKKTGETKTQTSTDGGQTWK